MINDEPKLAALLPLLQAADWIAIDTEADSLHAYPEKLCVLQISITGRDELIDPLTGLSLDPIWPVLRKHELILHGADYDLRLLRRSFGFVPQRIFDTMLAARFLGYTEFSLVSLLAAKLSVELEKGPQKMDWARRPLTERMERYARNDTRYLRPLAELLRGELEAKGRLAWHSETCSQLITDTSQAKKLDNESVWRVRGSDRLTPKALAILRELWHWRESEALEANKPPYFVLSHEHLVNLAAQAEHSHAPLHLPKLSARRQASLLGALERGRNVPSSEYPARRENKGRRLTRAEQTRSDELRGRRDRIGAELGIDPALIASRATLAALAQKGQAEAQNLMGWQRQLLFGKI
ncbi:MAG: HRDC domain-containing protein [Verrucomicrobiales bacterium]|nr:HRDC domain-containing protein [Verrucomicrobiales bacterium]